MSINRGKREWTAFLSRLKYNGRRRSQKAGSEGIGEGLNQESEPESRGRSARIAIALGIFGVVILIALGLIVWTFHSGAVPRKFAPRDIPDGSQSAASLSTSAPGELTVFLDQPGAAISPTLFGLALEEINHSLDGGLYAQLLPNRDLSDEYRAVLGGKVVTVDGRQTVVGGQLIEKPATWFLDKSDRVQADLQLDRAAPLPNTSCIMSLRLMVSAIGPGQYAGAASDGYWGIPIKPNWHYRASFYAKAGNDFSGPISVAIKSNDSATTYAGGVVEKILPVWQRYDVDLKTDANVGPSATNQFEISVAGKGTVWLAQISLFGPTFNDRLNGNRIDLMEKLADLKPGFIVFPGGDYLTGRNLRSRFDWKKTIGPVEKRFARPSTWHRTSNGFGLMEFLLTCDDLHTEPVLGIYDGTSTWQKVGPGATLEPYVQDALDEIEYVTGDKSTPWGARRAADGHPEPFKLRYVQIGNNEQMYNEETYDARFTQFHDAIKAKYPDLKLIGWMDLATKRTPDVRHESFYPTAKGLLDDRNHYDGYSRTGPRYASEFNAKEGDPTKTLFAALADMSWILGVQRNADVVTMATAAPLFVKVDGGAAQHPANLIGYDSLRSYGSPSYYALRMFNLNKGDTVIPINLVPPEVDVSGQSSFHGAIGVGSWGSDVEYKDIKVTAPGGNVLFQSDFSKSTEGWRIGEGTWKADGGTLHQTSDLIDCTAIAGDPGWTDYTHTLKAKKDGGNEGFLILVHAADDGNYVLWNLGGWENSSTSLEQTVDGGKFFLGEQVRNSIEMGRWYDIRVDVRGENIVCYLDGAPILTATERPHHLAAGSMSAAASRDNKTGEVILKVVNPMPQASVLDISLAGVLGVQDMGSLEVMSGLPGDVNTLNSPEKVSPNRVAIHFPGAHFSHEFPAYSISVLRLKPK